MFVVLGCVVARMLGTTCNRGLNNGARFAPRGGSFSAASTIP
jgi:hypothetical protein